MRPELIADRLFVKYLILLAFANTVRIKYEVVSIRLLSAMNVIVCIDHY